MQRIQSKPEVDKAPTAPTVEALSEESQTATKGTIVNNSTLIPVFSGTLANSVVQLCDARTLHAFMQVRRDFTTWIKGRIRKFGFTVGEDYATISRSPELGSGNRGAATDYHLTLDMAKELAMVENNEQGRAARRYFIECERRAMSTMSTNNATIDYARISPAQAQDLKEIVQAIVDAQVQTYGETWKRLQNKFRVNSYLQLPASRYEEARAYLIGKLPNGYAGAVYEENMPVERLDAALAAANTVAMQIQHAAVMAMMKSEDLRRGRWMVSFGYGADAAPSVKQIDGNACVLPIDKFHLAIEDTIAIDPQVLMRLATTCMNKMASMATRSTKALPA